MSYILEALRKSEAERRSSHTPTVTSGTYDQPMPPRQSSRLWVGITVVNLGLAVALVGWLLYPSFEASPPAQDVVETRSSPRVPDRSTRRAEVNTGVSELQQWQTELAQQRTTVEPAQTDAAIAGVASRAGSTPRSAPPIREQDLMEPVRARVRALEISSHSFTDVAAERLVYINGQRRQSGDTLAEGITLSEITEDGLLIEVAGQRVRINLMERWQL